MRDPKSLSAPASLTRCAIYTRKSTEDGLEQEFNSLDAQYEACAAYIASQRHEGWSLLPDRYDDGGISGGTLERPGLKRLLADVAAGLIDTIVIYKVDRLTRSLNDFARIVDVLDKAGASFVSVTQSFNTTTSMGRLTLNMLLSFAQFEREVGAERVRDKIAASKRKGMWMGGPVPLGYTLGDRRLLIDGKEALTVRTIFERYLELGSGRLLAAELDRRGIRSKVRVNRHGRRTGGSPLSRGALYAILQNRLYVGEVVHNGASYPGQHDGIVDPAVFTIVQERIELRRVERRLGTNAREPSLLAGLLYDGHGRRMSPVHAVKNGRRYRYYSSQRDGEDPQPAWRISVGDIEGRVIEALRDAMSNQTRSRVAAADLNGDMIELLHAKVETECEQLMGASISAAREIVLKLVQRIDIHPDEIVISGSMTAVDDCFGAAGAFVARAPIAAIRTGKTVKLVLPPPSTSVPAARNPALLKLVAQAFCARRAIESGKQFNEVAAELGYGREYLADMVRTSYLSPTIITAIIEGNQPAGLSRQQLVQTNRIPLDWNEQQAVFGF